MNKQSPPTLDCRHEQIEPVVILCFLEQVTFGAVNEVNILAS